MSKLRAWLHSDTPVIIGVFIFGLLLMCGILTIAMALLFGAA